jgi:glutaredoxin
MMSLRTAICLLMVLACHAAGAEEIRNRVDAEQPGPAVQATPDVILYSASWCGYCRKAREYFKKKGIPFVEIDVEMSTKGREDFARLHGRGVPLILVGDQRLNGFSRYRFDRLYADLLRKRAQLPEQSLRSTLHSSNTGWTG